MAIAFQQNAFQENAFQATPSSEVNVDLSDVVYMIGRGKRGKAFGRIGPKPDHDTKFREYVETNPGVSRNPGRRRNA